jgi:hypothetical protein
MDRRWWLPLGLVAALGAVVPIAAHAYLGTFARYIADDFCTASTLRRLGFLGSQGYWYQSWSGRYAYTFVVGLTQAVGPALTPWLPSMALLIWIGAVLYAARRFLGPGSPWLMALAIAIVHVVATLEGTPSVYQSLYWQTGMITYTLPLALATGYGAWLWQAARGEAKPRSWMAASAISLAAAYLLGGFSETYVFLQSAALALLLIFLLVSAPPPKRARIALVVGAGLAGSLLAALTIALAPGTEVRRDLMPAAPDLASWIGATTRDGYLFLARTVKGAPEAIVLAILLPCLLVLLRNLGQGGESDLEPRTKGGSVLVLLLLPIVTPILMWSTIAPYEFAVSSYPDARVLVTTVFVLITALVVWGANLGKLLARLPWMRTAPATAVALLLAIVLAVGLMATSRSATLATLGQAEAARAYAQSWDTRDGNLRQAAAAGAGLVPAASLRHMGGLAEIGRDPDEWINRCVAGTYGVGAVVAK